MSLSGLAFLFDIIVEDLKSFVPTKKFVIRSQFADIFSLVLKNPDKNEQKRKRKKSKGKAKKPKNADSAIQKKTCNAQTVLYVGRVDTLLAHMIRYPMEICLCSEYDPEERIGSTLIPWDQAFITYMMSLYREANPTPAINKSVYNVFHEATSKRMAAIRVNIKLCITDHVNLNNYKVLSEQYPNTFIMMDIDQLYIDQSPNIRELSENPGIIKTTYSGRKKKKRSSIKKRNAKRDENFAKRTEDRDKKSINGQSTNKVTMASKIQKNILNFTRSDTDIRKPFELDHFSSKSCSNIKQINLFDYIFGDRTGPFGNKTYTVGYFTVDNTKSKSPSATSASPRAIESQEKTSSKSSISLDQNKISTVKCDTVRCIYKKERPLLDKPDDRILLDITSVKHSCCVSDSIERKMEMIGIKTGEPVTDPCYCACECTLGFERKTTYCRICKGYEKRGEDLDGIPQYKMPNPCPVYHKLSKIKTGSTSGSDSKKESKKEIKKRLKSPEPEKESKNPEHDKVKTENKKKRRRKTRKAAKSPELNKKDSDRFKFNYGYKGIPPQIGHSQCMLTTSNVPKSMGWLWTAEDVPGMVARPSWKPGAINKIIARKLKKAQHPGEVIRKRRKAVGVKKRPLKRPLLIVHKKDGEFEVTMETMKSYNKPRTINQQPYEDKPLLTYTIGRTEEENRERKRKRERAARRLEREKREFLQSAFTDMCKEICLKTYQQALGILPDAEDPECACYPPLPDPNRVNEELSCSCSDDGESLGSDTDSDEWILEFTPPNAFYNPNYQGTKVKTMENETQYTYLDYRVKLLDRLGNPVPRFFKGPDGKEQCSDLGGFWNPDKKWLQINVDGFVGPDGRWAPTTFFGPSGEQVDTPTGKFQDTLGNWLVVGVDGYVDCNNKWKYYTKPMGKQHQGNKTRRSLTKSPKRPTAKKEIPVKKDGSPAFNCFGDANPEQLSRMGIVGHGSDKKILKRKFKDAGTGVKANITQTLQVPKSPATERSRVRQRAARFASDSESSACRHPKPSLKGVIQNLDGTRTYFTPRKFKNRNIKQRIHDLEQQGRSLSEFHEPCFHSNLDYKNRREGRRVIVTMPHGHDTHDRI